MLFSRELQRKGRGEEGNRNEDEGRRERNVVVELMRDRKGVAHSPRLQFYLGHRVPRSCWPLFVRHPSRTEAVREITRHVTRSCTGRPFTAVNRLQWHAHAAHIHNVNPILCTGAHKSADLPHTDSKGFSDQERDECRDWLCWQPRRPCASDKTILGMPRLQSSIV